MDAGGNSAVTDFVEDSLRPLAHNVDLDVSKLGSVHGLQVGEASADLLGRVETERLKPVEVFRGEVRAPGFEPGALGLV